MARSSLTFAAHAAITLASSFLVATVHAQSFDAGVPNTTLDGAASYAIAADAGVPSSASDAAAPADGGVDLGAPSPESDAVVTPDDAPMLPVADALQPRVVTAVDADAAAAQDATANEEAAGEETAETASFYFKLGGEYQFRLNVMGDVPLRPLPGAGSALGQNVWAEQWLRLRADLQIVPGLHVIGQADALNGVALGDLAQGVEPEARQRDEYAYPGLRFRYLYLEWQSKFGLLRVGQMGFSWGLGMVANDGDTPPVFGDYRYGDLVRRVLFAVRPAGNDVPFVVAAAGDWVASDLLADFHRRDELAFQGVLAAYYGDDLDRVGAYGAYRWQENALDDTLSAAFVDVFARWGKTLGGARYYAAAEGAFAIGSTTYARTAELPEQDVTQLLGIVQLGRTQRVLDVVLEAGYASGDSNGEDAIQRRGTIDPDHRVGLILFPEVISAFTARSAALAQDPGLSGRPARGSELLPSNGGVSGAAYAFPYGIWRPLDWLDVRLGAVVATATADFVDPYAQRALSRSQNFLGGPASSRFLGLELDGAVLAHHPIADDLVLSGGLEGGVLFPGGAFENASGDILGPIGLVRFRVGIRYR